MTTTDTSSKTDSSAGGDTGSIVAKTGSRRSYSVMIAAICLVIGLFATTLVTLNVRRSAENDARREFDNSASQAATSIRSAVDDYTTKLRDVGAFIANSENVSSDQLNAYLESSKVFEQIPSLSSLFYLRLTDDADLDAVIADEKASNPKFTLFQLGQHQPGEPHYLLTQYVAGSIDLSLPLGTDTGTIPSVAALLGNSAATGDTVVGSFGSDPMIKQIAEETDFPLINSLMATDFFIGVPIYAPPSGNPGDPSTLVGWSAAVVNDFSEVAHEATAGLPDSLGIALEVDLTATEFANSEDISRVAAIEGNAGPRENAAFTKSNSEEIDGVDWRIDIWSTSTAKKAPISVTLIFLAGITGSVLAAAFIYARMRAREREREFVIQAADRAQFQRDILDSVTNAMVVLDSEGLILDANPAWSHLHAASDPIDSTKSDNDFTIGKPYISVLSNSLRVGGDDLESNLANVLSGQAGEAETDVAIENGARHHWYSARATRLRGTSGGAVVMHTDITERKRSHDELELKASRDNLTGLLNRAAFHSEVDKALLRARAHDEGVAILFIDLDGFKPVNDTYGHAVGDDVLRAVAQRVTGAVRTTDRVARLGGDEFVVLMAPLKDQRTAESTAERVLQVLTQPVRVGGRAIPISASIGIASVDSPLSDDSDGLIGRADQAMYRAKQSGGSRAEVS